MNQQYYGITFDKRSNNYKSQLSINGKIRFFGYYQTDIGAAIATDCARIALAEFFQKPPPEPRFAGKHEEVTLLQKVREELIKEGAPTFSHLVEAESWQEQIAKLAKRGKEAIRIFNDVVKKLEQLEVTK